MLTIYRIVKTGSGGLTQGTFLVCLMDSFARAWVKAVLWAAIGLVSTSVIDSLFTGSLFVDGMMAGSNTLIGLASYVIYERVWSRISWGRQDRKSDSARHSGR